MKKKHHILPEFYISKFTPSGKRDDMLWIFDKKTKKQWQNRPSKAFAENHFYKVDIPGREDDFENDMADIENECSLSFDNVCKDKTFKSNKDFNNIIELIALLFLRCSYLRDVAIRMLPKYYEDKLAQITESKETFESYKNESLLKGERFPWTFEQAKRAVDNDITEYARVFHIDFIYSRLKKIKQMLIKRHWSLCVSLLPNSFICSDFPLVAFWPQNISGWLPGIDIPNTILRFPLSRTLLLEGYDTPRESQINFLDSKQIAAINGGFVDRCNRFIISPEKDFIGIDRNGHIRKGSDLFK